MVCDLQVICKNDMGELGNLHCNRRILVKFGLYLGLAVGFSHVDRFVIRWIVVVS